MNPIVHTENSMDKFKGTTEEDFNKFLAIHTKLDCSKAWISDNRHRALTHTLFWVKEVMIPIFGDYITTSIGNKIAVKDICEQHILEDYQMKFIPTPQDFLMELPFKDWMKNGEGIAPSAVKMHEVPPTPPKVEEPIDLSLGLPEWMRELPENMILDGQAARQDMILDGKQYRPRGRGGNSVLD